MEWLRRPETQLTDLFDKVSEFNSNGLSPEVIEAVEIQAKYAGYLEREQRMIERYKHLESKTIPESFDYFTVTELRNDAKEKFTRFRPRSLGQAARLSGISPADIATLSLYLFQRSRQSS